jgi:uncharacterized membrane protein
MKTSNRISALAVVGIITGAFILGISVGSSSTLAWWLSLSHTDRSMLIGVVISVILMCLGVSGLLIDAKQKRNASKDSAN